MSRAVQFLFAGAISLALASTALAQSTGYDIAWNDCVSQPGAAQNLAYACDGSRDGDPFRLVFSFIPPEVPNYVGLQAVFDMRTSGGALPDWWKMGVGECRDGALVFPASLSGIGTGTTGACRNPWLGTTLGGGYQWYSQDTIYEQIFMGAGRLRVAFARTSEIALEAGQRYLGGVITLDPARPVGHEDPCVGCSLPGCIVLNQVELYQPVGSPGGDIILLRTPLDHGFVTWQGGDVGGYGCPLSLPTRRATWGAIKAIYR